MFLQKLNLEASTSYETSTELENLLENLHISFAKIAVITPYLSKAMSDEDIGFLAKEKKADITLTIPQYKKYAELFDCSHVVVTDHNLLCEFGYKIEELGAPMIVVGELYKYEKLELCKFFVKAEKNERFVALYIIAQMFPVTVVARDVDRVKMFCRIFDLDANVIGEDEEYDASEDSCLVFLDKYKSIKCERVFIVGGKSYGHKRLLMDLSLAGKYKYRVLDIAKQLSPSVVERKASFDYTRFKNINL
ncbi:hypothetical protein ENBRE01_0958 [Enteropsectra breve]|nr:hypothetical protein ENBRE01_0958 [Enteropsectra breve]